MLWNRYFQEVVRVARNRLGNAPRRTADEEDVAISVFRNLCQAAAEDRFTKLTNRIELWKLLLKSTNDKAIDQLRRDCRLKRGGGNVRGESVFGQLADEWPEAGLAGVADEESVPDLSLFLDDLLSLLRDDTLKSVALLRLEGRSNKEIAECVDLAVGTVERKLDLIRKTWAKELER